MGERAEIFLNSFNRIEKWLREALGNPSNVGFSEMVRRLSRNKHGRLREFEEDLLQMAQLRNAIIHEKISADFIIAEPNEWAVERIRSIEEALTRPEKVLPKFQKKVTGIESRLPLTELLALIARKRYSQFPLYDQGKFAGLVTLRGLGYWFAVTAQKGSVDLTKRQAGELLFSKGKTTNYRFVSGETFVFQVEKLFREIATLEAVLITQDGQENQPLLGIIRPRDIYHREKD